ncbi:hypothetical protein [Streptomyces sp. NPDC046942]|uniref:hypothetical protein n=1 Tax=Streptomyces sp. NPDC046942 TaxID=3155137 RepID=UPI0033C39F63
MGEDLFGMGGAEACGGDEQRPRTADDLFRFPEGTDPAWRTYGNGGGRRAGLVVCTVLECLQAVDRDGTLGMAPLRVICPRNRPCRP